MSNQTDYTGKAPIYQKWDEKSFLFDTQHLHWMARSLYRTLLQNAFHLPTRPDLPDDDEQLRQIACGGDVEVWAKHGPAVRAMFKPDPDRKVLWQKRLRKDWQDLEIYRQNQKERADKRWQKERADHQGEAQQSEAQQSTAQQSKEEKSRAEQAALPTQCQRNARASLSPSPSLPSLSFPSGNGVNDTPAALSDDSSDVGQKLSSSVGQELSSSAKTASAESSLPPSDKSPCPTSGGGENQHQKRGQENQPHGQGNDVEYLQSVSVELGCQIPTREAVQALLRKYPVAEIEAAFREYVDNLDYKDQPYAEKLFFADGGAAAVILARRRMAEGVQP